VGVDLDVAVIGAGVVGQLMPGKLPALAVLIPMYNEEANTERCVRAVCAVLSSKVPSARLLVVNDGNQGDSRAPPERGSASSGRRS
jgi:hypothetical protein